MSNSPLVSILMNCYNSENYIEKAVNSVLEQKYKNWELIIWDDASTDDTIKKIKKFDDQRIKLFTNENHFGLGKSRINAIKNLNGSLIAILDSDDSYHVNKISKQVEIFEKFPEVSICATWAKVINEKNDLKYVINRKVDNEVLKKKLLCVNLINHSSIMYRKNLAANSSGGIVFTKKLNLHRKSLAYGDRGKILWKENLDFRDPKYSLFPALNWNTDEFSCAIGYANLKRLDQSNNLRKKFVFEFLKLLKKSKVCFNDDFHSGYAPFFLPIFVRLNKIKCSKLQFARALKAEGVDLGEHYGCLVNVWPWTKKYLKDKFIARNSIQTRDNCFHLFLNENYKKKHAQDIVSAILKVENYYKS